MHPADDVSDGGRPKDFGPAQRARRRAYEAAGTRPLTARELQAKGLLPVFGAKAAARSVGRLDLPPVRHDLYAALARRCSGASRAVRPAPRRSRTAAGTRAGPSDEPHLALVAGPAR